MNRNNSSSSLANLLITGLDLLRNRGFGVSDAIINYLMPLFCFKVLSDLEGKISATSPLQMNHVPVWSQKLSFAPDLTDSINDFFVLLKENNRAWQEVIPSTKFEARDSAILAQLILLLSKVQVREASSPGLAIETLLSVVTEKESMFGLYADPNDLAQLSARLLEVEPGMSLLDPACGTGLALVNAAKTVQDNGDEGSTLKVYGQDVDEQVFKVCQMNLLLHGLRPKDLVHTDTLLNPLIDKTNKLVQVDRVICTPPLGGKARDSDRLINDPFERFRFGLSSNTEALFLQHILASLNERGRAAVTTLHGILFRGGAEERLRKGIIQTDTLEAIVSLPRGMFYTTALPATILLFNQQKSWARQNKVLFIDASELGKREQRNKTTLNEADMNRIVDTFRRFSQEEGFSKIVATEEIAMNNYDLNPNHYLFADLPKLDISLAELAQNLVDKERRHRQATQNLEKVLKVLEVDVGNHGAD